MFLDIVRLTWIPKGEELAIVLFEHNVRIQEDDTVFARVDCLVADPQLGSFTTRTSDAKDPWHNAL